MVIFMEYGNEMEINEIGSYEQWRMYQAWLEYVVYDNGDE